MIIRNTSERQFEQEFMCTFLSSMNTLIDGHKIGEAPYSRADQADGKRQALDLRDAAGGSHLRHPGRYLAR
jgi:hypothetical protein